MTSQPSLFTTPVPAWAADWPACPHCDSRIFATWNQLIPAIWTIGTPEHAVGCRSCGKQWMETAA